MTKVTAANFERRSTMHAFSSGLVGKDISLLSASYALLAVPRGARVARGCLLQKPGASAQILCDVIRSHLRDVVRFRVKKEILCSPSLAPSGGATPCRPPRLGVPPHPWHRLDLVIGWALKPQRRARRLRAGMMGDNIGLLPSIGQPQRVLLARVWPVGLAWVQLWNVHCALRGAKN